MQDKPWRRCASSEKFFRRQHMIEQFDELSVGCSYGLKINKKKTKLLLDTSAYKRNHNMKRADGCRHNPLPSLDPNSINREVKVNPFRLILAMSQRPHATVRVGSTVGDTLRKFTD